MKPVGDDAWVLALGAANAVLLRDGDELTLIDAGFPNRENIVFEAIRSLGKQLADLKTIVFTHGHPDHIGSAAAIVRGTGARTFMHATDAALAETGGPFRPMTPAPGVLKHLMFRFLWRPNDRMAPFRINHLIEDGQMLEVAGGLKVVRMPGHCAGQVALLWKDGRLLLGGDCFMNLFGLGDPIGFEDEAEGRQSQRRLAALANEAVVFGHGPAITKGAKARLAAWTQTHS